MADATGEAKHPPLWVSFDPRLKLELHGARITSDGGLLAEVAVPRALFAAILRRIDRLRGPPMPAR